jgi:hypothetical protein
MSYRAIMLNKAHGAERVRPMANSTTIIRNVNLNYAKVHKAVKNDYDKVLFDIQVEFTKDRISEMSQYGNVRKSKLNEGMFCLNLTRPEKNKEGKKNAIRVVDNEKNPIKADIGNGSVGNVMVYSYDWSFGGKSGRKSVLIAVQVSTLVPYTPIEDFDVMVTEDTIEAAPVSDF